MDVQTELALEDGRYYVGVVTAGDGAIEGDLGSFAVRRGDTFACAASLAHAFRTGREPLEVVRCMGSRV